MAKNLDLAEQKTSKAKESIDTLFFE